MRELWSADGRRLTVLMEPGRIKRGLGAGPSHEPALVVGRTYSLVVAALGQTARHTFRVSDPVLEAVDETRWRLVSPVAGSLDPAVAHFGRVMTPPRLEDFCGNRLGEALDHDLGAGGPPRAGMINFTTRSVIAPSSAQAVS
jgi:hypothetical protein